MRNEPCSTATCNNAREPHAQKCEPCLAKKRDKLRDYMRNKHRLKVGIPIDAPLLTWKRRPQGINN